MGLKEQLRAEMEGWNSTSLFLVLLLAPPCFPPARVDMEPKKRQTAEAAKAPFAQNVS